LGIVLAVVLGLVMVGLRSIYGSPVAVTSRLPFLGGRADDDERELELID
jgi:hypothetical protein